MGNGEKKHGYGIEDFLWYVMMGMIPFTIPIVIDQWKKEKLNAADPVNTNETIRPLTRTEKAGFIVGLLGEVALVASIAMNRLS